MGKTVRGNITPVFVFMDETLLFIKNGMHFPKLWTYFQSEIEKIITMYNLKTAKTHNLALNQ